MWYPDYDGIYWADGRTLDAEGGDYQVIENLRVVYKVARRMRLRAIARVADRSFNSTPGSTAAAIMYFGKDLRDHGQGRHHQRPAVPGRYRLTQGWRYHHQVDRPRTWSPSTWWCAPWTAPRGSTVNIMLDLSLNNGEG